MKKAVSIAVSVLMLLALLPIASLAGPLSDLKNPSAAILNDVASAKVITEKNSNEALDAAGLVRLPALLYICREFDAGNISESDELTVTKEAASERGATAFLSPNERIKAGLLLKAAVMLNAGDAIHALMDRLCQSPAEALDRINDTLKGLGVHAYSSDHMGKGEKLTARELCSICCELSKSPSYLKYSSLYLDNLPHEKAAETELTNPNRLVRFYSGCFGLATGSVGSSNYCGAFIAKRGSTTLLVVVLGMPDSASRFRLATDLLDHGFSSYRSVSLGDAGELIGSLPVTMGKQKTVGLVTGGEVAALMPVSDTKLISEAVLPVSTEAPVVKGQVLGTLVLKNSSGEVLGEIAILAAESVDKAGFSDRFNEMLRSWLRLQ